MSIRGSARGRIGLSAEDLPEFLSIQDDSPEKQLVRELIVRAIKDYTEPHKSRWDRQNYRSAVGFFVADPSAGFASLRWCLQHLGPNSDAMYQAILTFIKSKLPDNTERRNNIYKLARRRHYNR